MERKKSLFGLGLILLIALIAGLVYYLYPRPETATEETSVAERTEKSTETEERGREPLEPSAGETPEEAPSAMEESGEVQPGSEPPLEEPMEAASGVSRPEIYSCDEIDRYVHEFFDYLDQQPYIRRIASNPDTLSQFKAFVGRLVETPPVPAGEGVDPRIIVQNVYHLFRTLTTEDLRLMRSIIRNEHDTLEHTLHVFYQWLAGAGNCEDPDPSPPPAAVSYRYAGFFLNTIGGRAYLSRRSPELRILATYYSVLIVHEADRTHTNAYGIDLRPHLSPLREELIHYPDFAYQQHYLQRLEKVREYYRKKKEGE